MDDQCTRLKSSEDKQQCGSLFCSVINVTRCK